MPERYNQRHLVAAWNPALRPNIIESHIDRLLEMSNGYRSGERDADDVYVWWAGARSPHQDGPPPHLDAILALDKECEAQSPDREVHLYLTDYNSMYVGHVGEICSEDVREQRGEREHMPEYYLKSDARIDCFFRLFDIRRIATDDQFTVIDELTKLRDVRLQNRPVSMYGGMANLPLLVVRPDGARYFEDEHRQLLSEGKLWVEFDAERVGLGRMEREVRENLFGDIAWRRLEPATRSFIATAERIFRDHRSDSSFDFTPVIVEFAKALEVQCNALLRRAFADVNPTLRLANVEGRSVDLATSALALGQLAHVVGQVEEVNRTLKQRLRHGEWFTSSLPPILKEVAELRNPAAHSRRVHVEEAGQLRNSLVGVGCHGVLLNLAEVQPVPLRGGDRAAK